LGVKQPFSIAYRPFVDGDLPRPYLMMYVQGADGRGRTVTGIVDSGADSTSFPFDYAALFGYDATSLREEAFIHAGGAGIAYMALHPCKAHVPEIPDVVFDIYPQFIRGAQMVLWGRRDFMRTFDVTIQEADQRFIVVPR
jgi:hypothetical protein